MGARIFVHHQSFGPIDFIVIPLIGIERDVERALFSV